MKSLASSFADPEDIAAYERTGSLALGDNGVGCWGDSTKQGSGPSCALHVSIIKAKWGSKNAGKHKKVIVRYGDKEVTCVLKDICGMKDRIDLNPDAVKAIGLKPPILVTVHWEWA